ncbi:MAG TPA: nuclear transport factor 2 family protein [Dehalococcoidia bacterium]|nr:nuclear transport factor 2 family protein [Dehalococcoidia bacterium]
MSVQKTVEDYIAAWNEEDEAKRADLIAGCWAESGTYTDPMADVAGRDGLSQLIAGFHQQMPGARIKVTTGIDQHHDQIRFGWALQGGQAIEGIDVGRLDGGGKLLSIVGFWGANPPAAS